MKLSAIKTECEKAYFTLVEIRKNPGDASEYIGLLYGRDGKSFMLCDSIGKLTPQGRGKPAPGPR
jgi:hypothetical protein